MNVFNISSLHFFSPEKQKKKEKGTRSKLLFDRMYKLYYKHIL